MMLDLFIAMIATLCAVSAIVLLALIPANESRKRHGGITFYKAGPWAVAIAKRKK
jgi:hypothetical protein